MKNGFYWMRHPAKPDKAESREWTIAEVDGDDVWCVGSELLSSLEKLTDCEFVGPIDPPPD